MAHNRRIEGLYKQAYGNFKINSPILNPLNGRASEEFANRTPKALQGLLLKYTKEGNPENDGSTLGRIQAAQRKVEKLEAQFQRYKQRLVNQGHAEPEEMPKHLQNDYHEALALYDVRREEADKLRKLIQQAETSEKKEMEHRRRREVLRYGPQGNGAGDPLREIDGQNVAMDADGELSICEEHSPYNTMKVKHYREHIVKPFLKKRAGLSRTQTMPRSKLPKWPKSVPAPAAAAQQ